MKLPPRVMLYVLICFVFEGIGWQLNLYLGQLIGFILAISCIWLLSLLPDRYFQE